MDYLSEDEIYYSLHKNYYDIRNLQQNDGFTLSCLYIFGDIIRSLLDTTRVLDTDRKRSILPTSVNEYNSTQQTALASQIFFKGKDGLSFFDILMKNYLYKIKLNYVNLNNSTFVSGKLLNYLLENM